MRRREFVVVAGLNLPPLIMSQLATKLSPRNEELVPLRGLQCPAGYTEKYVVKLYGRVANELKKLAPGNRETLLRQATLTLLYVDRAEGGVDKLRARFGVEALLSPLGVLSHAPVRTRNEVGALVNMMANRIRLAIQRVRPLQSAILEEVTNRDNKTCLLLPPKTFGSGFKTVQEKVNVAAISGYDSDEFRKELELVSNSIAARRVQKQRYFVGDRGLLFRSLRSRERDTG